MAPTYDSDRPTPVGPPGAPVARKESRIPVAVLSLGPAWFCLKSNRMCDVGNILFFTNLPKYPADTLLVSRSARSVRVLSSVSGVQGAENFSSHGERCGCRA